MTIRTYDRYDVCIRHGLSFSYCAPLFFPAKSGAITRRRTTLHPAQRDAAFTSNPGRTYVLCRAGPGEKAS